MKKWMVGGYAFAALTLSIGVSGAVAQDVAGDAAAAQATDLDVAQGIEIGELLSRIEEGYAPAILDVRTPEEFAEGHISGAINIPLAELEARASELGIGTSDELVVYCRTGRRAAIAEAALSELGYTNLRDLDGHIKGWQKAGYPLE
jgi:rhodanese-related sulfurtransferase